MTNTVAVTRAFAKINLALEVLGRRSDGYHEVRTILQTVSLCDELSATLAASRRLTITGEEAAGAPTGPTNLASQAVSAYMEAIPESYDLSDVQLRLRKRIPAACGLGGGSADAAAVLRAIDSLQPILAGPHALESMAAEIGSDVAFFVRGGTQLASGRGEQLEILPDAASASLVLLCPRLPLEAKTARLYGLLGWQHFSDGSRTKRLAARLRAGEPHEVQDYFNTFDEVADTAFHGQAAFRQALVSECGHAVLCGAGPSLFARVERPERALRAAQQLRANGMQAYAVQTVGAAESAAVSLMNDIPPVDILR